MGRVIEEDVGRVVKDRKMTCLESETWHQIYFVRALTLPLLLENNPSTLRAGWFLVFWFFSSNSETVVTKWLRVRGWFNIGFIWTLHYQLAVSSLYEIKLHKFIHYWCLIDCWLPYSYKVRWTCWSSGLIVCGVSLIPQPACLRVACLPYCVDPACRSDRRSICAMTFSFYSGIPYA